MELVFTGAFPCPICERDLPFSVYGLGIPADMAYFKQPQALAGAQDHARHEHWCRVHRLCAICGKHVTSGESGDLDCAVRTLTAFAAFRSRAGSRNRCSPISWWDVFTGTRSVPRDSWLTIGRFTPGY